MSKEERIKYVLGLLVEATANAKGTDIFTCYVNGNEIAMYQDSFCMVFDDYEIEKFNEEWNRFVKIVNGVKIYALTKEGIEPDDF